MPRIHLTPSQPDGGVSTTTQVQRRDHIFPTRMSNDRIRLIITNIQALFLRRHYEKESERQKKEIVDIIQRNTTRFKYNREDAGGEVCSICLLSFEIGNDMR